MRLVLLAVLVSLPCFAQDECALDEEALVGQVDEAKLPKGARLEPAVRTERLVRETVHLPDDETLVLQVSGCTHLGLVVELFSKKQVTAKLKPKAAVALLKARLQALAVKSDAVLQPAIFLEALRRLKTAPSKFPVPLKCDEYETCELELVTAPEPALRLTYDFPL